MARYGSALCVAQSSGQRHEYSVIDVKTGARIELFPFDPKLTHPLVKSLGKKEFLVTVVTEGTMGMFVSSEGSTVRTPIQWPNATPSSLAFQFPYVRLSIILSYTCCVSLLLTSPAMLWLCVIRRDL